MFGEKTLGKQHQEAGLLKADTSFCGIMPTSALLPRHLFYRCFCLQACGNSEMWSGDPREGVFGNSDAAKGSSTPRDRDCGCWWHEAGKCVPRGRRRSHGQWSSAPAEVSAVPCAPGSCPLEDPGEVKSCPIFPSFLQKTCLWQSHCRYILSGRHAQGYPGLPVPLELEK